MTLKFYNKISSLRKYYFENLNLIESINRYEEMTSLYFFYVCIQFYQITIYIRLLFLFVYGLTGQFPGDKHVPARIRLGLRKSVSLSPDEDE